MTLTYKAIARSAGYYAFSHRTTEGDLRWTWRESASYGTESASRLFHSEEEAYMDCCIEAHLIIRDYGR